MSRQRPPHRIALLPAGKAVVSAESDEKFTWLMQHTRPGDLFFQAQWIYLYPTFTLELVKWTARGQVRRPVWSMSN
jgi:hypothetical protein